MNNTIKISIIVPVYNAEKYLDKCLESITIQSLKEIEIICVNDGSKDNSGKILDKWATIDNRIIVIHKENGGASSARNTALKLSKGEYCLNIDSDDWIEQGYFLDMYEKAKKNNLDILISDLLFDYGDPKKNFVLKDLDIEDTKVLTGKEYLEKFYLDNQHAYSCNKLIKRSLFIENNIFYSEDMFLGEDFEVINKLAYFSVRIGKLNNWYYHYIQGDNNGSTKVNIKNLYDLLKCKNKLAKFYLENGEKNFFNKMILNRDSNMITIILGDYYSKKNKDYQEFLKKFIESIRENNTEYNFTLLKGKRYNYNMLILNILKKISLLDINIILNLNKLFISIIKNLK